MIKNILFAFSCFVVFISASAQTTLFDRDWKFFRGGAQRAEVPDYDDSKWRTVDLPHDWSIEDRPGTQSPFDSTAVGQVSTGFTVGGSGWYRKSFLIPAALKGKRIHIQFDGVYMDSEYWLNGESIGSHPYGYTSFWFNITDKIKFGENNIVAVQVRNEGQNSRWYTGSGIYRHVWLKALEPIHVSPWGIYITTPDAKSSSSKVNIQTSVTNKTANASEVRLVTRILNDKAAEVGKVESSHSVAANNSFDFKQEAVITSPQLWSTETPNLYTAISEIYQNDRLIDKTETKFGVRSISFDAANGFLLNGKSVELKGGCLHHDNGPLGAKAYDRAEERRIELLKSAGFNAIRCSHNPPSPAFLDACDRLGMLVIDETFDMWRIANNPHDYHLYFDEWWQRDVESMVMRDRNHPSIIIWSIGNEIREMETPKVIEVEKMLAAHIRKMEPTRPITAAVNGLSPKKDEFFSNLDLAGYNYGAGGDHGVPDLYAHDHDRVSNRVMLGTESYAMATFATWMPVIDHPYVIGDFVWTAFDYIGEASIGWRDYWQESNFYPWNLAFCGDIDICGWRRPQSFYREVLWRENKIALFVKPPVPSFPVNPNKQFWSKWEWYDAVADWNWSASTPLENTYAGQPLEVSVYSSCEQVELFLNGRSLGKKKTDRSTEFMAKWNVPYNAGELKAVGYKGKKEIASSVIRTAAEPVALKLTADRTNISAGGQDLSYITVELVDGNGNRNPKSENLIKFNIEGPGSIVAVGNANPMSIESFQLPQRRAWQGRCLVIVKSSDKPGTIKLTATADGLRPAEINVSSR